MPYTQFVVTESLSTAIRSRGLSPSNNKILTYYPKNLQASFDDVCWEVAKLYGCNLYLIDAVRNILRVYNYDPIRPDVFIQRGQTSFFVFDGEDTLREKKEFLEYNPEATPVDIDEEVEAEQSAENISVDFSEEEALGWYYDIDKNDPRNPFKLIHRNVISADNDLSKLEGDYDMIIQCPKSVAHVIGYSPGGMVTFPVSTLRTNKLHTPLLHIPHGYGLCLLSRVREVFLLDSTFTPVVWFEFFSEVVALVDGLESAKIAVLDMPLVTTLGELLDADIASKYKNIKIGEEIVQGECSYEYISLDRGDVPQSGTLSYIVSKWGVTKPVVCTQRSVLCASLNTIDTIFTVIDRYISTDKSILYATIEKFVDFLYRTGHSEEIPSYENLKDAFIAYQNIKIINSQLASSEGSLDINLSIFNHNPRTLSMQHWQEKNTKIPYHC